MAQTFSMPDTEELQEYFGQPVGQKERLRVSRGSSAALFDRRPRLMEEPVISPLYTSDLNITPLMHARMDSGDVLLGDDRLQFRGGILPWF